MNKIQLLIPMSGQGVRYQNAGYKDPKPLIPVNGRPMIERLLSHYPSYWPTHFVMNKDHESTRLPSLLKHLRPDSKISYVERHTKGPGHALLKGLESIPEDSPVMVSYCDFGMQWDAQAFEEFVRTSNCDICLVSYRGFHAHYLSPVPYAYSRLQNDRVVEVREKGSFTDDRENEFASCGAYYFRSAKILRTALDAQFKTDLSLNGEFYTSLTVEAYLRQNPEAHVRVFEIPGFYQWGTPSDLQNFEFWEKSFSAYNQSVGENQSVDQVLMTMAGLGSRFSQITTLPKPLIPVNGEQMFWRALHTLPRAPKTSIVALKSFSGQLNHRDIIDVVELEQTPEGQALSTLAGIHPLDLEKEVLVSSCDHGVALGPNIWKKFKANPDCDAAIFTIRGFPGASKKPKAYAYVQTKDDSQYPIVTSVSVKQPISDQPHKDAVLVGTFWFKSARLLAASIEALVKENIRVNNELYLDSVFEILIKGGHKVRAIPMEGYLCWGDPEALAEALYFEELFCGKKISKRSRYPGVE